MRIGILTFHRQLNYGGVLQAIALLRAIAELRPRAAVEIINLWHDRRDAALLGKVDNPNFSFLARWRNKRRAKRTPFGREAFKYRICKTKILLERYGGLSPETYKTGQALSRLPQYDTIVFGSDQIWNPTFDLTGPPDRNPYLGGSLPEAQQRVAYAASFGVEALPQEMYPAYRNAFSHFREVSVRETSGSRLFSDITGDPPPPVVPDPTLLHSAAFWKAWSSQRPTPTAPYLVAYWLDGVDAKRIAWLETYSRRVNLPIHLLVSKPIAVNPERSGVIIPHFDADPMDFVALIAHCEAILTDSFHGMVFASIFGRKGACFLPAEMNDATGPRRFHDFFATYGLSAAIYDLKALAEGRLSPEAVTPSPLAMTPARFEAEQQLGRTLLDRMLP